jgi:uncharacterized membrane protein YkvA (DUF1232 family)
MKSLRLLPILVWRFRRELKLTWAMVRSPLAPLRSKLLAIGAVLYVVSPIDLVPDVAPILGWIDDAAIFAGLIALSLKLLPQSVYDTLQREVDGNKATQPEVDSTRTNRSTSPRQSERPIIDVTPG